MKYRTPRKINQDLFTLVTQTAIPGIELFPDISYVVGFTDRLASAKRIHGFGIHAYGISPTSIRLIVMPNDNENLGNALRGVFTSVAKRAQAARGGSGHVYASKFASEVLLKDEDLAQARQDIITTTVNETAGRFGNANVVCTDWERDRYGLCDDPKINNRMSVPTGQIIEKMSKDSRNFYVYSEEVMELKIRPNRRKRKSANPLAPKRVDSVQTQAHADETE